MKRAHYLLSCLLITGLANLSQAKEQKSELRSAEWWLNRAAKEAKKIKSEQDRKKALQWINRALERREQDETKASDKDLREKAHRLIKQGRFEEAQTAIQKAPKRDRGNLYRSLGYAMVESAPEDAVKLARNQFTGEEHNPLSFGFDMAILARNVDLMKETLQRGFEHIKKQTKKDSRVKAARRNFVMQLDNAIQRRHQKGTQLSPQMKKIVLEALDRIVKENPEVAPTAAELFANLGEVDKAMKHANYGTGPSRTSVGSVVQALVKKRRYEEALKFAPEGLIHVAQGYAEEGKYEKAIEIANRIPLKRRRTETKGWKRNHVLSRIATVQAKAGKIQGALETLDHLVPTRDWNDAVERRDRTKAENQIQYATRLVHILAENKNEKEASRVLTFARGRLKKVPQEGRDSAVSSIDSAARKLKKFSQKTRSIEELQKLAEEANGPERIRLLAEIAEAHWKKKDAKAARAALEKAKKTAESVTLKPRQGIASWLSIAMAQHTMKEETKSAIEKAWKLAQESIAKGKKGSIMVRMYAYMPFLRAYHLMGRWDELPRAFEKIKSPFNRALAFYTVGAMLKKEGQELFKKLEQAKPSSD